MSLDVASWNLSSLTQWETPSAASKVSNIASLLKRGPVCLQETNWGPSGPVIAATTFPRAAVAASPALDVGSSGVAILVPAPFVLLEQREILPGYIIAATIARFEIKCDLVCVYMHPDALEEVGNSLLSYLEARTATREIFICGEFNRIDQKFSAIWELILATGLLRQVTGGFPTYRSGEKASELDAILHNEDAEGCRRFKTRVFLPKALPMGHGIVVLRARKARLLQNDVRAASQRTIPTRAFKPSTGEASLRIPAHNSHPAKLRLERLRFTLPATPRLSDLQSLFHLWWFQEQGVVARNVQAGKYGAFPTFYDGNAANRMLVLYIHTAIFATFAHLVSAWKCGNEALRVTLSAIKFNRW